MRKFKATKQKKLIGMAILFMFVPLFLLWYWVFFLGHKPGTDTMVILAAVALLAVFLYFRYKKQLAKAQAGVEGEELPEAGNGLPEDGETESDEEGEEEAESGEEGEEEAESKEAPEEDEEEEAEEDGLEEGEGEAESEEAQEEEEVPVKATAKAAATKRKGKK